MIIDIRLALMLLVVGFVMIRGESIMDDRMIDLKSKLYLIDSDPYLFNSSLVDDSSVLVSRSHLHSNQLNGSMVSRFFRLVNKTSVLLNVNETALSREGICSSIRYCHRKLALTASNLCVLNLNLIVYLSSTSNNQLNQIKLIDIDLVVNDLTGDYLHFEHRTYEFDVYVSKNDHLVRTISLGAVRALTGKNSDLIRYFLNSKDRKDQDLFTIHSSTGEITLNRTKFSSSHTGRKFKFGVDAQVQCAPGQRALYNQTHVTVNVRLDDEEEDNGKLTFNVTNFVPVRRLTSTTGHCLVLDGADLTTGSVNSIAIAQVQIENFNSDVDYGNVLDLSELNLAIDSIRPQLVHFKVELKHLVDNIYIVYVVKSHDRIEYLYLNDLYQVRLRFVHENLVRLRDIYVCVNTNKNTNNTSSLPLVDQLNLLQFESSLVNFKPVEVRSSIDIVLHKLTTSNVSYFIDDVVHPERFKIEPSGEWGLKFGLNESYKRPNDTLLAEEVTLVAMAEESAANFSELYAQSKNMAIKEETFLHFTTKVIVSYEHEHSVDDLTIEKVDAHSDHNTVVYKFNTIFGNLINGSVIGYLPSVHELNVPKFMHYQAGLTKFYQYRLATSSHCFTLNRHTGVLAYTTASDRISSCFGQYPVKLSVNLVNSASDRATINNYAQIWIYNRVNGIVPINVRYQLSHLVDNYVNLNYEINPPNDGKALMPRYLNLANLITEQTQSERVKFEMVNDEAGLFVLDTKTNGLYLKTHRTVSNGCSIVELIASRLIYVDSFERESNVESSHFKLNFCFYLNRNENQTSLVVPLGLNSISNFELLIRSRSIGANYAPLVWYLTLVLFSCLLTVLVLFLAYNMCLNGKSKQQQQQPAGQVGLTSLGHQAPAANAYENFETKLFLSRASSSSAASSWYNSSSSSPSTTSNLQIRNDQSMRTSQSSELHKMTDHDERLVPSKLDIMLNRKPLDVAMQQRASVVGEMSTIKAINEELSDDHGVYCLATGTSFTSNISSVSASQCNEVELNTYLNHHQVAAMYSTVTAKTPVRSGLEKTRLSLFDITPMPVMTTSNEFDKEIVYILSSDNFNTHSHYENTYARISIEKECII